MKEIQGEDVTAYTVRCGCKDDNPEVDVPGVLYKDIVFIPYSFRCVHCGCDPRIVCSYFDVRRVIGGV